MPEEGARQLLCSCCKCNVVTGADEAEEARLLSGLARTSEEGQSDRQSAEVDRLRS